MSPEQVTKQAYHKKVDIWACCIIMYQLLAQGAHPCHIKGEPADAYVAKLENIETQPIKFSFPENFSAMAIDFF